MKHNQIKSIAALAALSILASACAAAKPAAEGEYKVGMILVGPLNDKGWNEAHIEGSQYVMAKNPNVKFDYVDKVNPADRPNVKGSQVADELIAKGAKLIIFNSDDFKDDSLETARKHPDIPVIHASGDYAWKDGQNYKDQPNLGNYMPAMEYGKQIGGCAAALGSQTGKIGYLGPLTNDETRRYVNNAYLGAKYCWENYLKKGPKDLQFKVTWIGFWFNLPGVTLDPTKVADDFYNGGYDVVMSGIDTPEAAVQGDKAFKAGKPVKFVHYDYRAGCELSPDICLGVPYFNWGPGYLDIIARAMKGEYKGEWTFGQPDWKDINNPDTSAVGFELGQGLGNNRKFLDQFIQGLADGSVDLLKGPHKFQDGSDYLKDGEKPTLQQLWYVPQLLQGIEGASSAQ